MQKSTLTLQCNRIFLPELKRSFVYGLFIKEKASGFPYASCNMCNYTIQQCFAITQPLSFECCKSFCKHSLNSLHNILADKVYVLTMSQHLRLGHRKILGLAQGHALRIDGNPGHLPSHYLMPIPTCNFLRLDFKYRLMPSF